MKTSILLSGLLIAVGTSTIFAQQRGNPARQGRSGATTARNINASQTVSQEARLARNDTATGNRERVPPAERPDNPPNNKTKLSTLLRGLELSDMQKRKVNQIFQEARENGTPTTQVLREINSILRPNQSEKFINKIKRIQNQNEPKPKPKKLKKVLRKVELSKNQWAKVDSILKHARENETPLNEVLRQINSILRPEQSREFKHLIKRIYQNNSDSDSNAAGEGT